MGLEPTTFCMASTPGSSVNPAWFVGTDTESDGRRVAFDEAAVRDAPQSESRRNGTYRSASASESTAWELTGAFDESLELFGHSVLIWLGMAIRFRSLFGGECSLLVGTYTAPGRPTSLRRRPFG